MPDSVVVAVPTVKLELVPYAKPRTVVEANPSSVIFPFNVSVDVETDVGTEVVILGTTAFCVVTVIVEVE